MRCRPRVKDHSVLLVSPYVGCCSSPSHRHFLHFLILWRSPRFLMGNVRHITCFFFLIYIFLFTEPAPKATTQPLRTFSNDSNVWRPLHRNITISSQQIYPRRLSHSLSTKRIYLYRHVRVRFRAKVVHGDRKWAGLARTTVTYASLAIVQRSFPPPTFSSKFVLSNCNYYSEFKKLWSDFFIQVLIVFFFCHTETTGTCPRDFESGSSSSPRGICSGC